MQPSGCTQKPETELDCVGLPSGDTRPRSTAWASSWALEKASVGTGLPRTRGSSPRKRWLREHDEADAERDGGSR